jgi:hypothetical protein
MFGGLGAWLASEVSGAVRRNLIIYGLYGFAALLVLCAGGYALGALHTVLALRYGAVEASLWIAGGLFLAGIVSLLTAVYVKSRPRPSRPPVAQTALFAAPIAAKLMGSRMGWKGGLLAGVAILGLVLGRQILKGTDEDDGEDEA